MIGRSCILQSWGNVGLGVWRGVSDTVLVVVGGPTAVGVGNAGGSWSGGTMWGDVTPSEGGGRDRGGLVAVSGCAGGCFIGPSVWKMVLLRWGRRQQLCDVGSTAVRQLHVVR